MASAGWEAGVPSRIGLFETEVGGIVLADLANTMIYLGTKSKRMYTSSNMNELASIDWPACKV